MSARRPSLATIVLTPTAIAAGAAFGLWLYKRWGYAVESDEQTVARVESPPEADGPKIQKAASGEGPRFHRIYRVQIAGAALTPEALIEHIGSDFEPFAAPEVARFEKTEGETGALSLGDEYMVHINGPWNGPVRAVKVEPTRFVLATLEGHMEAGQIEFRAESAPATERASGAEASGDDLVFTIESWARSRDAVVDATYDGLGVGKAAQQAMWTFFCNRVVEESGGETVGEIEVTTEREAE